ncbi:hypothetical protein EKO23_06475 [Nocardioides guangzhouensis]|uniref:Uncharacterized protein n=1 Tax=Nocardioides guangzhouensis TaxID=2497878 RepID=A0A4Q4ZHF7_9ACTN|nr:hypothetical protein [Nocardioides guangzhouensis]RYP87245.1 hypothetical protein EKO23_06475 [Nocardioides guangzhouensis]
MADQEREDSGPSLEMPSLGTMFRRRRGREQSAAAGDAPDPTAPDPTAPDPTAPDPTAAAPTAAPPADPGPGGEVSDPGPTAVESSAPGRRAEGSDTEPQVPPLFADEVATDDEVTAETPAAAEAAPTRVQTAVAEAPSEEDADDRAEGGSRRARRSGGPILAGMPSRLAALVTGALVGLLAVGLTYAGLVGCDAWRGTQTCGGPGLLFLALILVAMVAVGALLLRAAGVADATSTSVLAVGLFAVVCLLVLIDALFSTWMVVVLPVVGALAYALAHWVTATYGDSASRA